MCQVNMELYTTILFRFILWQDIFWRFYLSYILYFHYRQHDLQQRITELVETSHTSLEDEEEDEPKPKKQKHSDAHSLHN